MRAPVTKVIGEHTYRVKQLDLHTALGILPIVLRCIGPTLAAVLEGSKSLSDVLDGEGLVAGRALREFSLSVTAADLREITDVLAKGSEVELHTKAGAFVPLDTIAKTHFPERYNEWLLWLVFAVKVNFESFLGGLGNVENVLAAFRKDPASGSPTASTGTSGVS
jgi:hypothetical protein